MLERVSRRAVVAGLLILVPAAAAPLPGSPILPPELRDLWPGRRTAVSRGARSTVVGPAGASPASLDELARAADSAGARVSGVLGRPVRPLIVLPESGRDAARLARTTPFDGLAAVADGRRVIVVPEAFATLNRTGRDVVLTHELTHVVAGTGGVPVWLYEGFADYVGYRDSGLPVATAAAELAAEVRAGHLPNALPGPEAFAANGADPGRLARAYQEAWLACRFLADRFGEGTLVRLYREARVAGVDRALASLGLSVATLTARWRTYVRDRLV
ncbi:unnamed protein product [[Actinomadura] parvosata subsp. kistnae]|uniref:hypothetical protein n=1 Tax=[Actinomadura] parvosata TaxID=1955412 RepID=UPI000D27A64B|nr:hypothetical protein [Nonomuraea sp. ATCC 55076]SPL96157.1 unnamed protein product [Actinomadura parvosata subsp. kistnae]